jgi:hypothetical protein
MQSRRDLAACRRLDAESFVEWSAMAAAFAPDHIVVVTDSPRADNRIDNNRGPFQLMVANCARKQTESRQRGTLIAERALGPTRSRLSAHPSKPGR